MVDAKRQALLNLERTAEATSATLLFNQQPDLNRETRLSQTMAFSVDAALRAEASPLEILRVFAENTKKLAIGILGLSR